MNCPKSGNELSCTEEVSGTFLYPIKDGVIDWDDKEFYGDSSQSIRCECGYTMPVQEFKEILSRSLKV
jgi:hypothetical protein